MSPWEDIRDSAFQVVVLTQRDDKLWTFPTRRDEPLYAPPGAEEYGDRARAKFGHSSITVSYNAILAADRASAGEMRPLVLSVDKGLTAYRRADGAYGSPTKRREGEFSFNVVPRHTAMAALFLLTFKGDRHPVEVLRHVTPTISWLIANQWEGGGWPYDQKESAQEFGFMSTASALAALGAYQAYKGAARDDAPALLNEDVGRAISTLDTQMQGPIWIGDGSRADHSIRDAAFALEMLLKERTLAILVDHRARVQRMLAEFSQAAGSQGWPSRPDEPTADASATIAGLLVHYAAQSAGLSTPGVSSSSMDEFILSGWSDETLIDSIDSWDWQNLALLAAQRVGPMSAKRRVELMRRCAAVIEKRSDQTATKQTLEAFEPKMRRVVEYVLACGGQLPEPTSEVGEKLKEIRWDFAKNALWAALVALTTFVVSKLMGWIG